MKIKYKLLLGFGSLACIIAAIDYYIHNDLNNKIFSTFSQLNKDSVPALMILEQMRFESLRIISSTIEFGFIKAEENKSKVQSQSGAEEQLVEEGKNSFRQLLRDYHAIQSTSIEINLYNQIKESFERVIHTSAEIINLKKANIYGETVLEKKEQFEKDETELLRDIDAALTHEKAELQQSEKELFSVIGKNDRMEWIVLASIIIATMSIGMFVSRAISQSIRKVQEAAIEISRGKRHSKITVQSKDEIGSLARSFNLMVDNLVSVERDLREANLNLEKHTKELLNEISERKIAEETLRESEEHFRTLVEGQGEGVGIVDENENFLFINPAGAKIFGVTEEQLVGMNIKAFTTSEQFTSVENQTQRRRVGEKGNYEIQIHAYDGNVRDVEITAAPWIKDGKFIGGLGIFHDITDRKRVEKELLMYKLGLERSEDAVFLTTVNGTITYINSAFEKMYGFTNEEAIGKTPRIIKSGTLQQKVYTHFWNSLLDKKVVRGELINKTKDGRVIVVDSSANPIEDEQGNIVGFLAIQRDITERKHAEEKIRMYERTIQSVNDAINIADLNDNLILVNPAFCRMYGYTEEEIIGKNTSILRSLKNPEDSVSRILPETLAGGWQGELYNRKKDGTEFPIHLTTSPIRNAEGNIFTVVGAARDITERKKAEEVLKELNADLQIRNDELDAFSRTVAHDLKNPIGLIMGYTEELMENYAEMSEDTRQECIQALSWSAGKSISIIEELLLLSRMRHTEVLLQPVDVDDIVSEVQKRLSKMIRGMDAEIIQQQSLPPALGYAPWIEEVLINYLSNALKYGGRPPRIDISSEVQANGKIKFLVKDNGAGLTEEERSKLFIPFTRLGQIKIEGHGLGLSIVQRIMERLGGEFGVDSEVGKGSVFYFTLPIAV